MGRLSKKKKSCLNNLRKGRRTIEFVSLESEDLTVVESQPTETAFRSINSTLKDTGVGKKKLFSRGLVYSARYQRKLKQKNREMANGSAKISSYFNSMKTPVVEEAPVVTELEKLKTA